MKLAILQGTTSLIVPVFIQDSSATTGVGLGSLDQTSSIVGGYTRVGGTGVALAVDENVTTEGTYQAPSVVGKVRIGTPANMRTGDYELHFHNDLFATGAESVVVSLGGAANMAELRLEIQLTSPTRGLVGSALPNAPSDDGAGIFLKADASTVDDLADGVWDEAKAGHTTADTYGKLVQDADTLLDALVMQSTTIATLASQTSFTLTAGSADDTAYAKMLAVVTDQSTGVQKAVGVISGYVGSSKTITLREDPLIFTMATGDKIDIVVVSPDILTTLDQIGRLANVGAASNVPANGFVLTTGSQVNTFADTEELDGTLHELSDAAGTLDALYKFDVESDNVPTLVTFTGIFKGGNDDFIISANAGTDATPVWKQIGTLEGTGSNDTVVESFTLFANQIVTDVADEVQIRINNTGLTSSSFDVDQVFVSRSSVFKSVGYANGQIWVNTVSGKSGTIKDKNGVADNAVLTWAEAVTISGLFVVPMTDFHAINGSTIQLSGNSDNYSLFGDNWILQLNNKSVADAYFQGAHVSGLSTSSTEVHFEGCDVATASIQLGHFDFCSFSGTITHTLAGSYNYHNCYSGIAGPSAPTFTKTAGQTIDVAWRNWAGGITVSGIQSGDTMTIGGTLGTVTLNGADGVVEIRGTYKAIVDNRTGAPTLNLVGALNEESGVIATWDRIISKANHDIGQSAGKILRLSGNIAQVDGAVSDVSPAVGGFDTNLTDVDTYWEDAVLVFSNGAANAGLGLPISTFLNTNGAMTFAAPDDWPVTPVNGDDFTIYANHVHPVSQIADEVLATQLTESYAADGAAPTVTQALMMIQQMLGDFAISGTTLTVKKVDGSTTAATFTLDDATNPTSLTRTT